jgi:hypothetical protein
MTKTVPMPVSRRVLTCMAAIAAVALAPTAAGAVVYCKTVGVPKGCVAAPVVVPRAVAVPRAVVATPRVGVPRYGVGVGAPGVGVRAGTPANRGGPVNRVGRR